MKVFLSASNQVSNPWAWGNTHEKEQAERFADRLQALLEQQGVEVVRADKVNPFARIEWAKGCDLYVPLHTNAHNGKTRGCRLFAYRERGGTSQALAEKNAAAMEAIREQVAGLGMSCQPLAYYDFAGWTELNNAAAAGIPAVYSEAIFHDNQDDCKWYLANADRLAEAYARGICAFGGVEYRNQASAKVYRVQVGAFMEEKNARVMVEKLKQAGFAGFVTEALI